MAIVVGEKGEPMELIEISICLLIIYAIIIRRQVDRIEEKIDTLLSDVWVWTRDERGTDEADR